MKKYLTLLALTFLAIPQAFAEKDADYGRVKILLCEMNLTGCPAHGHDQVSAPATLVLQKLAKKYKEKKWPAFDAGKAMEQYRTLANCEQEFAATTPACLADAIEDSRK